MYHSAWSGILVSVSHSPYHHTWTYTGPTIGLSLIDLGLFRADSPFSIQTPGAISQETAKEAGWSIGQINVPNGPSFIPETASLLFVPGLAPLCLLLRKRQK